MVRMTAVIIQTRRTVTHVCVNRGSSDVTMASVSLRLGHVTNQMIAEITLMNNLSTYNAVSTQYSAFIQLLRVCVHSRSVIDVRGSNSGTDSLTQASILSSSVK